LNRKGLAVGLILLFIVSIVTPMTLGHDINNTTDKRSVNNSDDFAFRRFDKYFFPESYSSEKNRFEIDVSNVTSEVSTFSKETIYSSLVEKIPFQTVSYVGLIDFPWPMHCHDTRHTGRSLYSTIDTWDVIWSVKDEKYFMMGSPVIDKDGTIYTSSLDFYAVNSNGTIKWTYDINGYTWSAPAIDENNTIYFGTVYGSNFYALYQNGTQKWRLSASNVFNSPAIGNDGIIYFADTDNWQLKAVYPNGTIKWVFTANHHIYSSPAIGEDGSIYFGSIDGYVYAVYPNGTLKWKFNTGNWIHGSASIGDDGTVYIGSDGSLWALYPNNGTMKWNLNIGAIWSTPVIDQDGNIYVGSWDYKFYSIYSNGTIRWVFNAPGRFWFGTSGAISADGTIYFGTN